MPEASRITNTQKIAKYVARYIRYLAVANTRLYKYDGKSVTFWYKDDTLLWCIQSKNNIQDTPLSGSSLVRKSPMQP